jgi:5-methylcytosine-specific restriction endonuclease McrA
MQKIVKNEPKFFKNAKQKVKIPNISKAWEDKNIKDIKAKLREYIIKEQQNMCAYCEQKLENIEKLSIDHFKKRDPVSYTHLTLPTIA